MSKKKSLGSSPIGYSSLGRESFGFIPTIEKTSDSENSDSPHSASEPFKSRSDEIFRPLQSSGSDHTVQKCIVSYYLEEALVERLREVADNRNMYYSTIVNHAISLWLESRGYD